jgi:hypothetical protein
MSGPYVMVIESAYRLCVNVNTLGKMRRNGGGKRK